MDGAAHRRAARVRARARRHASTLADRTAPLLLDIVVAPDPTFDA
jgi:hypothetical protein